MPPHIPPLPPPPYTLRPAFTRPLSLWNPLDYLRLSYWAFFHPQWVREYVRWCAPSYSERPRAGETWYALMTNASLRTFTLQSLMLTGALPFLLNYMWSQVGLPISYRLVAGNALSGVVVGVVGGIAGGVAIGVAGSVAFGVTASVGFVGVAALAFGVAVISESGQAIGLVWVLLSHWCMVQRSVLDSK